MQVPSACFVQPPLAYVGCTEEDAIAEYAGDIDVYVSKFKPMKNTISEREERTLMKLLVHSATDQVRAPHCRAAPTACRTSCMPVAHLRPCIFNARLHTCKGNAMACQKGFSGSQMCAHTQEYTMGLVK